MSANKNLRYLNKRGTAKEKILISGGIVLTLVLFSIHGLRAEEQEIVVTSTNTGAALSNVIETISGIGRFFTGENEANAESDDERKARESSRSLISLSRLHSVNTESLLTLVYERKTLMQKLIKDDASAFLRQSLSPEDRKNLPVSIQKLIEERKTIQGRFVLAIVEREDGTSDSFGAIETGIPTDPSYRIYPTNKLQNIAPGSLVQIKGVALDGMVAVDSTAPEAFQILESDQSTFSPSASGNDNVPPSYVVPALTHGNQTRWNYPSATGTPIAITFAFLQSVPSYYESTASERNNFAPFNDLQKQAARDALKNIGDFSNTTFTEVPQSEAQIVFGTADLPNATGWTYPGEPYGDKSGDVWIDNLFSPNETPTPGNGAYTTMFHEIGHAMSLKHPHEGFALPVDEETRQYSAMSYTMQPGSYGAEPRTYMPYDLVALQYLYGHNTNSLSGDTTYEFPGDSRLVMSLWDGSGVDTLDASLNTLPATLDLREGSYHSIGLFVSTYPAIHNIGNAYQTVIDSAKGGSADDVIISNRANNNLTGGVGADTFTFIAPWGNDSITDFTVGLDKIDLSRSGLSFEDVVITENSGDTFISHNEGTIRLVGIQSSNISNNDFLSKDTSVPTVTLSQPVSQSTVSNTIQLNATASDDRSIAKVEFYIDNALYQWDSFGSNGYVRSLDTKKIDDGVHTILAKAYDLAGNIGVSPSVTIQVANNNSDTSVPFVSITSPANGSTLSGTTNVSVNATDNVGVTRVEFYVDGGLRSSDTSSPFSWSFDTTTVSNGNHTIAAKAYDAAGNYSFHTIAIAVNNTSGDTVPPTVSITSPSDGAILGSKTTVNISASDNVKVTKVELFVDEILKATDTKSPYAFSWSTRNVSSGTHILTAKAYDAAGNIGTSAPISVIK